jgi:hypothetical protein
VGGLSTPSVFIELLPEKSGEYGLSLYLSHAKDDLVCVHNIKPEVRFVAPEIHILKFPKTLIYFELPQSFYGVHGQRDDD